MKLKEAFEIVLDLASQNIIEYPNEDEEGEVARQEAALEAIETLQSQLTPEKLDEDY